MPVIPVPRDNPAVVIAPADAPAHWKAAARATRGVVLGGTADSADINTVIDGAGATLVQFGPGNIAVDDTILWGSWQHGRGCGVGSSSGTVLTATAGMYKDIMAYSSADDTGAWAHGLILEGFRIDGNKANNAAVVGGTATSGTTTTLTKTGAGWTVNAYAGRYAKITAGQGAEQVAKIASNTSDTLTFAYPVMTTLNNTSVFEIRPGIAVNVGQMGEVSVVREVQMMSMGNVGIRICRNAIPIDLHNISGFNGNDCIIDLPQLNGNARLSVVGGDDNVNGILRASCSTASTGIITVQGLKSERNGAGVSEPVIHLVNFAGIFEGTGIVAQNFSGTATSVIKATIREPYGVIADMRGIGYTNQYEAFDTTKTVSRGTGIFAVRIDTVRRDTPTQFGTSTNYAQFDRTGRFRSFQTTPPSVVLTNGTADGTGSTASASGSDQHGTVTLTTGTGVAASTSGSPQILFTLVSNAAADTAPRTARLTPANFNAAALAHNQTPYADVDQGDVAAAAVNFRAGSVALADSTTYKWYYEVV